MRARAALVADRAWLRHQVIGLHKGGFVFLRPEGQSVLPSAKVTCVSGICIVMVMKHFVARCMDTGQLLYCRLYTPSRSGCCRAKWIPSASALNGTANAVGTVSARREVIKWRRSHPCVMCFILPYIMPSVRGYERCHKRYNQMITKCVRSEVNMPDRKLDGFLLYKNSRNIIPYRNGPTGYQYNSRHRAISSSIHYIYFASHMSSQGQCTMISARSSSDVASVNASSFICLQSATVSL